MTNLVTLYSSNIPVNCYLLKGRLETEGIPCFIFDENMITVHPFRAVALGGVKLKVPIDRFNESQHILSLLAQGRLPDENGEYVIAEVFDNEIKRQNEILALKYIIRNESIVAPEDFTYKSDYLDQSEIEDILREDIESANLYGKKFEFSWKEFFYEWFDFDRSLFKYLRSKPADYYIEKEIVDNYNKPLASEESCICPNCHSDNVAHGYAHDYKWDVPYLFVSIVLSVPIFPLRKKYHCFECGFNFKNNLRGNHK